MEELAIRLNNIDDSYYGFVVAVLTYVKKKASRYEIVEAFLNTHPLALSSDVLEFISGQDDFYEDAVPAQAEAS